MGGSNMSFHVGAHALILNNQNKVLVTRRSAVNDYMPLLWDIPGGYVDIGETVEQALVREVKEETSISIVPVKPIYVYTELSYLPNVQWVQIVYECIYDGEEVVLTPEEHDEYQWVDYNDIKKFKCIAFLENLIREYKINEN